MKLALKPPTSQRPSPLGPASMHVQTEKTIQQLKNSLGSIQKMIEKSQQILRNTRHLNPREIRSDSLELRLKNDSRQKSKHRGNFTDLNQSATQDLRKTNNSSSWHTETHAEHAKTSARTNLPQQTKPIRPHLFIETDQQPQEHMQPPHTDTKKRRREKIFIHDSMSPVSAAANNQTLNEQSMADGLESPYHFGRRFKTDHINDSFERSQLGESLERYSSIERKSNCTRASGHDEHPVKKIVLRRKINNVTASNFMQNLSDLENYSKEKRKCIFQVDRQPEKAKQGKYSYYRPNPQCNFASGEIKQKLEAQKSPKGNVFNRLSSPPKKIPDPCLRFNKQNQQSSLDEFYKKVKQFGFVQRYLNRTQISCIFEYLKKSSIPEHKWPLYVVDKVYEKMQSMPKLP